MITDNYINLKKKESKMERIWTKKDWKLKSVKYKTTKYKWNKIVKKTNVFEYAVIVISSKNLKTIY